MVHRVGNENCEGLNDISISEDNFKSLMRDLKKHFNFISNLNVMPSGGRGHGEVLLTFDDAYQSIIPSLHELNLQRIPYIIFPITSYLESPRPFWWDVWDLALKKGEVELLRRSLHEFFPEAEEDFFWDSRDLEKIKLLECSRLEAMTTSLYHEMKKNDPELRLDCSMNWQQLENLHSSQMVVGCHGHQHAIFSNLSIRQMHEELEQSQRELQFHFPQKTMSFAYPCGQYSPVAQSIVNAQGFDSIFSTNQGRFDDSRGLKLVPRFNINDEFVSSVTGKYSFATFLWNLWRRDSLLMPFTYSEKIKKYSSLKLLSEDL